MIVFTAELGGDGNDGTKYRDGSRQEIEMNDCGAVLAVSR
jgi:hypothetical protein